MARIYIASKMTHAERWRQLYSETEHHIVSRWPFLEPFIEPTPKNAVKFWQTDEEDIERCDVLICYVEPDEHLRGTLVEVGMALAYGKDVVLLGEHPDYGTWQHHPLVRRFPDLQTALFWINGLG